MKKAIFILSLLAMLVLAGCQGAQEAGEVIPEPEHDDHEHTEGDGHDHADEEHMEEAPAEEEIFEVEEEIEDFDLEFDESDYDLE